MRRDANTKPLSGPNEALSLTAVTLAPDQRIARHKDFLQANWRALASFSWENFQARGKGCVLAIEEDFVHADRPQYAPVDFRYLPASRRDEMKDSGVTLGPKESAWLEEYDPAQKVIVMVLRDTPGGISSYLIGGTPSPPEAFRLAKAKEN